MLKKMFANRGKNRRGIALLMVVGMLSLLMIMAIAFSVLMRQGRASAANDSHQKSANHVIHVAFARALKAIDEQTDDWPVPNWPDGWIVREFNGRPKQIVYDETSKHAKAPEDVLISVDTNNVTRGPNIANVVCPAMTNHITQMFLRRITEDSRTEVRPETMQFCAPEWCPVYDAEGSLVGRYGFVVLNTSGLLDASAVGGFTNSLPVPRMMGFTPEEIQLYPDILPELMTLVTSSDTSEQDKVAKDFLLQRSYSVVRGGLDRFLVGEFGSLGEFARKTGPNFLEPRALSSFRVFSRSLPHFHGITSINNGYQIKIKKKADIQNKKNDIIKAFEKAVVTEKLRMSWGNITSQEMGTRLYNALVDFANTNPTASPEGANDAEKYERPTVKAVPLPLQIGVRMYMTREEEMDESVFPPVLSKVTIRARYQFGVNCDFPFYDRASTSKAPVPDAQLQITMQDDSSDGSPSGGIGIGLGGGGGGYGSLRLYNASPSGNDQFTLPKKTIKEGDIGFHFESDSPAYVTTKIYDIAAGEAEDSAFEFDHKVMCRVDVLNTGNEPLAKRPANEADGRFLTFYLKTRFGNSGFDPLPPEGALMEPPWRYFWIEALDSRVAWDHKHWLPSHRSDYYVSTQIITLEELASSDYSLPAAINGVSLANNGFMATIMGKRSAVNTVRQKLREKQNHSLQFVDGATKSDKMDPQETILRGYVRNGPLQSVGELAFLQLDPYFTIQLYDTDCLDSNNQDVLPTQARPWKNNNPARYHPVLDYFTLDDAKTPVRGKVNLASTFKFYDKAPSQSLNAPSLANTDYQIIAVPSLASVFAGMPVNFNLDNNTASSQYRILAFNKDSENQDETLNKRRYYFGKTLANKTIHYDNAQAIAMRLAEIQEKCREDAKNKTGTARKEAFMRPSDLAGLFEGAGRFQSSGGADTIVDVIFNSKNNSDLKKGAIFGKWERDALIANSVNLFSTRDQTFTILMRADSFTLGPGMQDVGKGTVLGTAYAVADIWRDPVPDANGRHPVHVQSFKILE